MITLYYASGTAALAPHIVLEELGTAYTANKVNFADNDQRSAAYLAVNPKGRVPALETDQGVLTETPAILTYLAQSHPDANLIPADPFGFGRAQEVMSYLASTVHVAHAHKMRGARWSDDPASYDSMRAKVAQNMTDCMTLIEDSYMQGPWVMGDRYSVVDPYLFTITRWLKGDGVNIADFPGLAAHAEAMKQRAAVQRVVAIHD
jgi:glutathione S-transferase